MGPMFYLVQCEEELLLISAVLLADWPHWFAPAPSREKRAWLDSFSAGAKGWGGDFRTNGGVRVHSTKALAAFSSSQAGGSRDLVAAREGRANATR